jgi:hypothetical protein
MMPRDSQVDAHVHTNVISSFVRRIRVTRVCALKFVLRGMGAVILALIPGCGVSVAQSFPNQLVGAEGQRFTVEDLEAIANDPDLDDEEKREAFRDLGILDEKLIDALLTL